MITEEKIRALTQGVESPILEFKREWYWVDSTNSDEKNRQWGELIKDIVALANGYPGGYVGRPRHLIIGFDDGQKQFFDISAVGNIKELPHTGDFGKLKKIILQKLANSTRPALTKIELHKLSVDNKTVLCIEILFSPTIKRFGLT